MFMFMLTLACKKQATVATNIAEPPVPVEAPAKMPASIPEIVMDMARNFERVYFDIDSAQLNQEGKDALLENVGLMQSNNGLRIEIQGHADERGTTDYNLALGLKRAQSVADFMQSQGVSVSRIRVVSYGEERPLQQGSDERVWSRNRRCEFAILWSDAENIQGTIE
jgi:peptidoglycan-associated lipoprotein